MRRDKADTPLAPCNACRSATHPREVTVVYDTTVIRCLDHQACIVRARRAGIYGVIPRPLR